MSALALIRSGCSSTTWQKGLIFYIYPHSSPSDSFTIARDKAFIQQGVFLEDETSVICGSDHGDIYIYSLGTSKCLQKLRHGSRKTKIQVLNVSSHLTPVHHGLSDAAIRSVQRQIGTWLQVVQMKINQLFISGKSTRRDIMSSHGIVDVIPWLYWFS